MKKLTSSTPMAIHYLFGAIIMFLLTTTIIVLGFVFLEPTLVSLGLICTASTFGYCVTILCLDAYTSFKK